MISKIDYKGLQISSWLILLMPLFLITGPFLPDLSLVILILIFLYNSFNLKLKNFYQEKFFKFFLFFYVLIVFSSLISDYKLFSLKSSLPYIRFGLFTLASYLIFSLRKENITYLSKIFICIILILLIDTMIQYLFSYNLFGWKVDDTNFRVTSFFGKDEVLGSYVARFFPFGLSIILFAKEKLNVSYSKYIYFFILVSSLIISFISGERTAFFLILISTITIILTCKNLRKIFLISSLIAILLISILSIIDKRIKNRMLDFTLYQIGLTGDKERLFLFSEIYESHYMISLKMFKEKPLFGHGTKSFRKYCGKKENYLAEDACTTHPHNVYMQLLAETGIISFMIVFSVFIILAIKLAHISYASFVRKNSLQSDYITLIYIFYFVNLFPIAPSGNLFNNWMSIIYFFPSGYLIYLKNYDANN